MAKKATTTKPGVDPDKKPKHIKKLKLDGDHLWKTRRTYWALYLTGNAYYSIKDLAGIDPGDILDHARICYSLAASPKVHVLAAVPDTEAEQVVAALNRDERRKARDVANAAARKAAKAA